MRKKSLMLAICMFLFFIISYSVTAPPAPHNVRGRVFHLDGVTGVPNGVKVAINESNSSDYITTQVYSPPFEQGWYAATVNGTDNDTIIITAWNNTHYGQNITTLANGTTYANIALNTTRAAETNTTIILPSNNSIRNASTYFNVTAVIAAIGGQDAIGCSAEIIFSNNILVLATGETMIHDLAGISLGSSKTTTWNITAMAEGSVNITVNSSCDSDGINLDGLNRYTAYNITIRDYAPPFIILESPANNSMSRATNDPIIFKYNISDFSTILNCSLMINGTINKTNSTVERNISQNFSVILPIGDYNWSVRCFDNSSIHNLGYSNAHNLFITPNALPDITNMAIEDPIDLTAGSIKLVFCNATVTDEDNLSDLQEVNSTFYFSSYESTTEDDNNYHYSNNSCMNISQGAFAANYSCSFAISYYANNGSWYCNMTAKDLNNASGSNKLETIINDMLAIDISPMIIDYGVLDPGNTSINDSNVTLTNYGNVPINVTLSGYGAAEGDNLSMDCVIGNISIGHERYSIDYNKNFDEMNELTNTSAFIGNFTLAQRTDDATYKNDKNYTYWKMRIPYSVKSSCNGTITFTAILN